MRTRWDLIEQTDGLLGVKADGFLSRLTKLAVAAGFTERDEGDTFSPVVTIGFREPGTGEEAGLRRPISFVIMPIEEDPTNGLSDAGFLVMGGPPRL